MQGDRKNKTFLKLEDCPLKYNGQLPNKFIDITNKTYNHLKVLYYIGIKNHRTEWLCQCLNCNKYTIVNSHNLRSGHTKSCGCLISQNLRKDLTGKTFNYLKVIKYDKSINENPYWEVECLNCGRKYSVCGDALKYQYSCGCIMSIMELKIKKLFDEYNIQYKQQVVFDGLVGFKNNKLRYDFGVYNGEQLLYLIECQGIQHYYNVFKISEDKFNHRLSLDVKKREFCTKNNIKLLEIKYDEEITIEKILLFKTKNIIYEDFVQYKKPTMFISNTICKNFKCDKENGCNYCINSELISFKNTYISFDTLINNYKNNPITSSITFGGLENFDEFQQLYNLIKIFRQHCSDDIVIYTGYYDYEIEEQIEKLKQFSNIIIKFGRYIPNQQSHYDEVLGIKLASDNQYAERIS